MKKEQEEIMKRCEVFVCLLFYSFGTLQAMEFENNASAELFSDFQIRNYEEIDTFVNKYGKQYSKASDSKGNTPLHILMQYFPIRCDKDFAEIKRLAELLLTYNASLAAQNHSGKTPLHLVAQRGINWRSVGLGSFLYTVNPDELNKQDELGYTPLDYVMLDRERELAKYDSWKSLNWKHIANDLIRHGAYKLAPEVARKLNIHQESLRGSIKYVKLLCENNLNLLNMLGCADEKYPDFLCTPLNAAVLGLHDTFNVVPRGLLCDEKFLRISNRKKIITFLLANGALLTIPDSLGNTPLHNIAICEEHNDAYKLLRLFLKFAPKLVDIQDDKGNTPLHVVRTKESARVLLLFGATDEALNNSGQSPKDIIFEKYRNYQQLAENKESTWADIDANYEASLHCKTILDTLESWAQYKGKEHKRDKNLELQWNLELEK